MAQDDELDFDHMMAEDGAKRLGRPRLPVVRPAVGPPGVAPPPGPARPTPDPRVEALTAELRDARTRALRQDEAVAALQAQVATERAAREALAAQLAPLQHAVGTAKLRVEAAERARASAEDRLARQPAVISAPAPAPAPVPQALPPTTLAEALAARGVTAEEQQRAVAALGATLEARSLLDQLVAADADAFEGFLDRRLALVCGAPTCVPQDAAAVLVVEPARCDVCGGSDIQRAAGNFAKACAAAGVTRVRVIGGSPNYRTQLEHLFPKGEALMVLTMRGDKKVPLQRSKRHQAHDDLVIVWGATELDHSTSGAYRAEFGRVMIVAHRGIARMLELAAERITAEPGA